MTTIVEDPAQTFCYCGEPIRIYNVPYGHVALPIKWIENGCANCKKKSNKKRRFGSDAG